MPELPEVEVICQGLRPHLTGRVITAIQSSGKDLRHPVPHSLMNEILCGQTIRAVTRRAKYLLIETEDEKLSRSSAVLDARDTRSSLTVVIIHLGMTGNLGIFPHATPLKIHDHVRWRLDNGLELRLNDTRRFGAVWLLTPKQAENIETDFFGTTGPEPFSKTCTPAHFMALARARKQPVKTFLMDSKVVAGIGNIYANEALFAAGIHPCREVCTLQEDDWQLLIQLIRQILIQAIACGGSTISDFINASGESGYFQMNFKVYGRKGQPCHQCGSPIEKTQISGRASYFCPSCQKG
ncbi:MAG: bifunctional DNA-formamidopyrimidine glycosylase/DNA-(apurinic or apyrimidinic site) lyase [Proteobacteria bacterium]|nr:bifunctional DNA-formamidopyrimidine glycosylase/DNA-(apurinic or apyrimidinic site) lyase [Desulfocapsa sp.]MBU3944532.1 bifunctional DNA-formamidopyrimidine glycosylase/DNA-(apurinic or apyrimidinic site) lyase [Pseudomonadota bacterium]MCG2744119.1 bifunctional DNA-formamidopyrimidine glycosylase/DNA-(apurinic or apyrimidinic site) lyase [Desulfobacteraceae bacterium]MBU3983394.1 bifunctional DNA-formamidopyrimidine glycosylase/DNA-(apurinic or apyrimidinic site) lyase [Pseudomonadota bact